MVQYKLGEIVREYLIGIGDEQMNRFTRFYTYGVELLREWNMDLTGMPQCVVIDIDTNTDTAPMPFDCLNWTFIGIIGTDGMMYPLGLRPDIAMAKAYDACGNPTKYVSNTLIAGQLAPIMPELYAEHYRNGQLAGKFFGIGGGNNGNGYFRVEGNLIKLNGIPFETTSIYMEYIQDINAKDKDYIVHPFLLETLKDGLYFKGIQRDRNFSLGEKSMAEDKYWRSYRVSKKRFNSTPLSVWYEAIRHQNKAAPKF